jgi:hypothetical protein
MNWIMRVLWTSFIALPLAGLFAPLNAYCDINKLRSLSRVVDAIIIPGNDVHEMTGRDISNLRLLSLRDGAVSPIPFQIDQRDSASQWVWDPSSGAERLRDDEDPKRRAVFDANDLLVFIARDTGDRLADSTAIDHSDAIAEITVTDPVDGSQGWVYLAYFPSNPPSLSARRYVHYDKAKKTIKTANYESSYSDIHLAVLDTLRLNGQSILDRTKVRGRVEVGFLFFRFNIDFNEEEIGGYDEGYINGPVRLVKQSINYLIMANGMETPDVLCDHFFYPEYSELPLVLSMQFPVKKISLRVTADYFGAPFRRVYAEGLAEPVILSESVSERNLLEGANDAHWMSLDGKEGSIVMLLKVPEAIAPYTLVSPWLVAAPKAHFPPESIAGADPEAGFMVKTGEDFPSGQYVLHAIYQFSPAPYRPEDARHAVDLLYRPLEYQVLQRE